MNTTATRRNPLSTMLIISAIDVLLCAFTATVTLFFLGGNIAKPHHDVGIGWSGTLVVLSSPDGIQFDAPANAEILQPGLAFRLKVVPTANNPARFRVAKGSSAISQLNVLIVQEGTDGHNAQFTLHCTESVEYAFRIVDGDSPVIPESSCGVSASSQAAIWETSAVRSEVSSQ
jgi:hypothetical protein